MCDLTFGGTAEISFSVAILVQLRLHGVSSCRDWAVSYTTTKN